MNVVSSSGDVLHTHPHHAHHHSLALSHPLSVSVGGTDEEGEVVSPDEEGRTRRRPARGQSRIEFERLAAFFHVPINEAAKGLGVCATVLKKVCRKHGIPRWPHRKIKKLDTMLAMLETAANKPGNPQHDDDVRKKMDAVMRDRAVLMTEGKLIGEGKSDSRRKSDGKGRDRKRKKPDDDDEDDHDGEDSSRAVISYSLGHSGEQDMMQAGAGQMMMPMHNGHMTGMEMNGMSAYHMGNMGSYAAYGSYPGANGIAIPGNSYASYNSLFWNGPMGVPNNISLPSVHSISSGVISSTGMMMNNLPPPNISLAATPISPLTPLAPSLSSSNPLPIPLHAKHAKLSHSDVLLDHSHSYPSPSPSPYVYHRSASTPHLGQYSEFSVQHEADTSSSSSSHFRLFNPHDSLHPPTTASE